MHCQTVVVAIYPQDLLHDCRTEIAFDFLRILSLIVMMALSMCQSIRCLPGKYSSPVGPSRRFAQAHGHSLRYCPATPREFSDRNVSTYSISQDVELPLEVDSRGKTRMAYKEDGYQWWTWRSHDIHYVQAGDSGPIVLLIHGFGASSYHWRYLIPTLSQNARVYALDLLGFGWSTKADSVDYEGYSVWSEQISDFIKEVIHVDQRTKGTGDEKVVLVGNSLGGYNSLSTAAKYPELVESVVLLNAAGRFDLDASADEMEKSADPEATGVNAIVEMIATRIKRLVVGITFLFTKQPARVKQVLKQVYHSHDNVDEALVQSILTPADDPRAAEVFYRVITSRGTPINLLLDSMDENKIPLFLLWGKNDPWCVEANAHRIKDYYKDAELTLIESGHCPHDDTPELVLNELCRYLKV